MSILERQKDLNINNDQSLTVIGAGGVGFWVVKFAAMAGINKIYVFDPDVFEEHNLNRIDIPYKFLGKNKADVIRSIVNDLRPEHSIFSFPFKYSQSLSTNTDWVVDCTDKYKSQLKNQEIAKSIGSKYFKAGYDGDKFSINNVVAEWGESEDGYQITPSWVVPAVVIAAISVAKIMKYYNYETSGSIEELFKYKGNYKNV